ncbi:MAG TPA: chemotaxis protein CheD [Firmicutes bacterium]|jgi:chemotaxis protein CheD|nr:chemotaxis protein CheD [Bacillota bacterium]
MTEWIRVGMAELKVGKAPAKIITLGLGSCIGVCAYNTTLKVGGIAHIMLPDSSLGIGTINQAKFADTAIPLLIEQLESQGAIKEQIIVRIVGGAEMFSASGQNVHLGVGERNIIAVEEICRRLNLVLSAKSTGGHAGKSVTLDLNTGVIEIKSMSSTFIL